MKRIKTYAQLERHLCETLCLSLEFSSNRNSELLKLESDVKQAIKDLKEDPNASIPENLLEKLAGAIARYEGEEKLLHQVEETVELGMSLKHTYPDQQPDEEPEEHP